MTPYSGWKASRLIKTALNVAFMTLAFLGLHFSQGTAQAQTPSVTPEVKAAALAEGEVNLWSAYGGDYLESLRREGEKALGIKINAQRLTAFKLAERAAKEFDAGINQMDVIIFSVPDPVADFKERGMIAPFVPSSLDKFRSKELYDAEHYWNAMSIDLGSIVYNTSVVTGDLIPRTYKDMTDPKYKGMQIAGSMNSGTRTFAYWWWQWYGEQFFHDLKRNDIQIGASGQTSGPMVARGERGVFIADTFNFMQIKNQDAPVAVVVPEDEVSGIISPVILMSKAPHPNAAKLLLDWMLSPDGQAVLANTGCLSPVDDPRIQYPAELAEVFKNPKLQIATPEQVNTWWNETAKEKLTALFGGS